MAPEAVVRMHQCQKGFSLIELTVVLFILGLLLQASITPMSSRIEHRRRIDSADQLRDVRNYLRAYWVSYGYLPCPVNEAVALDNASTCGTAFGGVPANELGMTGPINDQGSLLDAWNQPLRYQVSLADVNADDFPSTPDWLVAGEMSRIDFTELRADLSVCRASLSTGCTSEVQIASDIVAVVVSGGGREHNLESDNRDQDTRFIDAPFSSSSATSFDDQLTWLGRSELVYWALEAGWLP